ncbi:MAG: type II toxin-antitoxin system RelE/ParE family toxin [Betaproteobacteria bacterium]|nr:type II toxin-antitoxin system RelE/ParE family toxin [Betaproteobacteria bacterium]
MYLYISTIKDLKFVGNSLRDLATFPDIARREAGFELWQVQLGLMPSDFKPMPTVGVGAYEIRIKLQGQWRVIYVAKKADAVYVLHCFHKTTQKTAKADIELPLPAQTDWRLMMDADNTTVSSGNVFTDLGFAPGEAAVLALRADLMGRLRLLVQSKAGLQAQAAERFGIAQSRVSDLLRGKWDKFQPGHAITLAARAGRKVELAMSS